MAEPKSVTIEDGKKFYFQSKYCLLTYKHHISKKEYIDWFKTLGVKIVNIRLAHESGDNDESTPYEHTHVVAKFDERFQSKNCRIFDFSGVLTNGELEEDIHPNIKRLPNEKAYKDALIYIAKEDPENEDLKENKSLYEKVKNCKNIDEALTKYVKKPSDVLGISTLYQFGYDGDYRIRKIEDRNIILKPWQKTLFDILQKLPDDRKIIWIYDHNGNTGKSFFAEYMNEYDRSKYRVFTDLGNNKDASTVVENELKSGWMQHGCFINLARQTEHHERMYTYLENIKDGRMTTTKYSGKTIKFNTPHLIVFANFPPMVNKLSMDRWDIYHIEKNELIHKKPEYFLKDEESCEIFDMKKFMLSKNKGKIPDQ